MNSHGIYSTPFIVINYISSINCSNKRYSKWAVGFSLTKLLSNCSLDIDNFGNSIILECISIEPYQWSNPLDITITEQIPDCRALVESARFERPPIIISLFFFLCCFFITCLDSICIQVPHHKTPAVLRPT